MGSSTRCALGSAFCLLRFRYDAFTLGGLATRRACRRTGPSPRWCDGTRLTISAIVRSWGSMWTGLRAGSWHDRGSPVGERTCWSDWLDPSGFWTGPLGAGGLPKTSLGRSLLGKWFSIVLGASGRSGRRFPTSPKK